MSDFYTNRPIQSNLIFDKTYTSYQDLTQNGSNDGIYPKRLVNISYEFEGNPQTNREKDAPNSYNNTVWQKQSDGSYKEIADLDTTLELDGSENFPSTTRPFWVAGISKEKKFLPFELKNGESISLTYGTQGITINHANSLTTGQTVYYTLPSINLHNDTSVSLHPQGNFTFNKTGHLTQRVEDSVNDSDFISLNTTDSSLKFTANSFNDKPAIQINHRTINETVSGETLENKTVGLKYNSISGIDTVFVKDLATFSSNKLSVPFYNFFSFIINNPASNPLIWADSTDSTLSAPTCTINIYDSKGTLIKNKVYSCGVEYTGSDSFVYGHTDGSEPLTLTISYTYGSLGGDTMANFIRNNSKVYTVPKSTPVLTLPCFAFNQTGHFKKSSTITNQDVEFDPLYFRVAKNGSSISLTLNQQFVKRIETLEEKVANLG